MLELRGVRAGYGRIEVLHGIDLTVGEGEILTIVGANGAGKSTLLRAISGVVRISGGSITYDGQRIDSLGVENIVSRRLIQIPEGRQLFGPMSVEENLELGGYSRRRHGSPASERLERVFALFPRLKERMSQQAGTLSGGEQQMLAIGRALMADPQVLLLDEPSLGLAPILVKTIFKTIKEINEAGVTIVLVEQNARAALKLAHRGYVFEVGKVVLEDTSASLLADPNVQNAYLGGGHTN